MAKITKVTRKTEVETTIQNKFQGSTGWLVFWIIIFWPAAIIYYFSRKKPVRVEVHRE